MIDYELLNKGLMAIQKDGFLVIYKEGSYSRDEGVALSHLKSLKFYDDNTDLMMRICGMRFSGIVVEEGANLSWQNFRYVLTRLYDENEKYIFIMDCAHQEMLNDIIEDMYACAEDRSYTDDFVSRIQLVTPPRIEE